MLAVNTLTHIDVLEGQLKNAIASESNTRLKCGRPVGSNNSVPKKKKNEQHMKSVVLLKSLQI